MSAGRARRSSKRARVLVVGAGGLGAPLMQYLAAAGVGTLGVIDDDVVSLSNLQRQVIHATIDIGAPEGGERRGGDRAAQPACRVETHPTRLTAANALDLVRGYDIVADGSDNFATRYLVVRRLLLRQEAAGDRGGRHVRRHADDDPRARARRDGKPNPTYRCLFPEPPPAGRRPGLRRGRHARRARRRDGLDDGAGGDPRDRRLRRGLVGRDLMVDARGMRFETMNYGWDPR